MPGETLIWLDGELESALPLPDRGLDFGDGLFETLLVHNSELLFLPLHAERLQRGCQALAFPGCEAAVLEQLRHAANGIAAAGWLWSALRLTLTRGAGPRGYAPPQECRPRIILTATRLADSQPELAAPATMGLANIRWPTQPALSGLKHLNRIEQVLAAREYKLSGFDEAVMLDQQGRVLSAVAGNIFYLVDGRLQTPALDKCGIAGTRRDLIIRRWAPALGLTVTQGSLTAAQLEQAEEVFYSNSLVGIRPVGRFGQRNWEKHSVCEALFEQYRSALA